MKSFVKRSKRLYITPVLKVQYVEVEYSLAASSSTLRPGGPDGSSTPEIVNWEEETITGDLNL